MKQLFTTFALLLAMVATTSAQSLRVGFRVGANAADLSLPKVTFEDGYIVSGNTRVGVETALVARLNITPHLHLQTEFEYSRSGYQLRYVAPIIEQRVKIDANRVEIPLIIGVNIGPLRLFGGTFIRIAHSEKSDIPILAKIKFNDSDVGLMGGVGVNIRNFFIETRISGYPRTVIKSHIESRGVQQQVRVRQHIRYSLSTGIFF